MNLMVRHSNFMSGSTVGDVIDGKMFEGEDALYARDKSRLAESGFAASKNPTPIGPNANNDYEPDKPFGWKNTPPLNLFKASNVESELMVMMSKNPNVCMMSKYSNNAENVQGGEGMSQ